MTFCPFVRPSVRMEQLGFCWTIFRKILNLNIFRESVDKIKTPLKPAKKDGQFT